MRHDLKALEAIGNNPNPPRDLFEDAFSASSAELAWRSFNGDAAAASELFERLLPDVEWWMDNGECHLKKGGMESYAGAGTDGEAMLCALLWYMIADLKKPL